MRRSAAACGSVRMPMGVLATVTAVVSMMLLPTAGQAQTAATDSWSAPRTSWGDPDLQGIWDYSTLTPLQRPRELAGKEFFAEEEAAEFRRRRVALFEPSWSFFPVDLELTEDKRTSLIVDPPDGRIPPLTPQGQERLDAMRAANQRPLTARTTEPCSSVVSWGAPPDRRCFLLVLTVPQQNPWVKCSLWI